MTGRENDIVRAEITKSLAELAPDRLLDNPVIDDHQDLLEFVDSFGFVQLLMAIEGPLNIELDLTSIDLGSIVRFDDLVAFIVKSACDANVSDLVPAK